MPPEAALTGHCYCGQSTLWTAAPPLTVAYCHCGDCRRLTGAPVAAFAAFDSADLHLQSAALAYEINAGVRRWACPVCHSPLAATYDYLPSQTYVPIGILDQAAQMPPEQHSHTDSALPWCTITDDLPRFAGSGRDRLRAQGT